MLDPASGAEIAPPTDKGGSEQAPPFGASFFLTRLAAFVRDHCAAADEALPLVHIHLAGGEILELCHVITLEPRWAALDVVDQRIGDESQTTRTELVPYEQVQRITIRSGDATGSYIGFRQPKPPMVVADPELPFRMAASAAPPESPDPPDASKAAKST